MATGTVMFDVGSPSLMTTQIDLSKDLRLLFDANTAEYAIWQFRMPVNYASGLVAKLQYAMASATSGTVDFEVSLMALSDGDSADLDTDSFDTANSGSATVPGTAGYPDELSIAMANADSVAAGDYCRLKVQRDATDGTNDTATGDVEMRNVVLEYTTT